MDVFKFDPKQTKAIISISNGYTDFLSCISIIFYNLELYNDIILYVREDLKDLCDFVFKNKKNIKYHYCPSGNKLPDGTHVDNFKKSILDNKDFYAEYKRLFYSANRHIHNVPISYPRSKNTISFFYKDLHIDNSIFINYFNIERDLELEKRRYEKVVNDLGENYIITNEGGGTVLSKLYFNNGKVNRKYFKNNKLPLFNLNFSSDVMFDMIMIIEKSKEIHLISTSWSLLILLLQKKFNLFNNIPIYFHNYIRPNHVGDYYDDLPKNWTYLK